MQTSLITKLAQSGQIKSSSPIYLTSEASQPSRIRFTNAVNSMLQEQRERENEKLEQESFQHYHQPHTEHYNFSEITPGQEDEYEETDLEDEFHAGKFYQPTINRKYFPNKKPLNARHIHLNCNNSSISVNINTLKVIICVIVGTLALVMFIKIMTEEKKLEVLYDQLMRIRNLR